MEHLRVAGLVSPTVIEEIGELLLRSQLVFDIARAFQALRPSDRRHDGGEIGELPRLQAGELIARLRRLQRAGGGLTGRNQRIDLRAGVLQILHDAGLYSHCILESGQ